MGNLSSRSKKSKKGTSPLAAKTSASSSSSTNPLSTSNKSGERGAALDAPSLSATSKKSSLSKLTASPRKSKEKKSLIVVPSEPLGFSKKDVGELFMKYLGEERRSTSGELTMLPEGVERFLLDLELDPEDAVVVALSWYMKAETMCYYRQSEFSRVFEHFQVDSISKLKGVIPSLREALKKSDTAAEIFDFAFGWSCDAPSKRALDMETAIYMLDLLLVDHDSLPLSGLLVEFLREQTSYKALNRDQWLSAREFCLTISPDLENYDENGSFPVLFDDFVTWLKEKDPEKYKQDDDSQDREECLVNYNF